jgi:protein tyrosine/serine phosphatase
MSRPRLTEQDKKIKLSITISRESNIVLEKLTNNKSKFIEEIIMIIANEKNRK